MNNERRIIRRKKTETQQNESVQTNYKPTEPAVKILDEEFIVAGYGSIRAVRRRTNELKPPSEAAASYAEEACESAENQEPKLEAQSQNRNECRITVRKMKDELRALGIRAAIPTIRKKADEISASRPDLWREERPSSTGISMYYEPAFAKAIIDELILERTVPEGYLQAEPSGLHIYELVSATGHSFYDAHSIAINIPDEAERYKAEHAQWVQNKIDTLGNNHDYYSKDMRIKLAEDLAPFLTQEGKNYQQLSADFGLSDAVIYEKVKQLNRPEFIKQWRSSESNRRQDILAPELVEILAKEYERAPDNMLSYKKIADILGISVINLRNRIIRIAADKLAPYASAVYFNFATKRREKYWDKTIIDLLRK